MASFKHTFTSGQTVTPARLNDARDVFDIVNADIKSDAAIAGTKIAPDFGSQSIATSGQIRITTSGAPADLYVAESANDSSAGQLHLQKSRGTSASPTVVQTNDDVGLVRFYGHDGTQYIEAARITAEIDGTPGTNDMPGRLIFSTTPDGASSPLERMRIASNGLIYFGEFSSPNTAILNTICSSTVVGLSSNVSGGSTSTRTHVQFSNSNGVVGAISTQASSTNYSTSSDYRLKQNVEPMVGGLAKLAALSPKTFEFINEPNVKVDGFLAHEVAEVVPAAVVGEKDAVEMQGIDHSRLVPVLVAAVQELSAKVDALEAALQTK
jgi:hypothetical protein